MGEITRQNAFICKWINLFGKPMKISEAFSGKFANSMQYSVLLSILLSDGGWQQKKIKNNYGKVWGLAKK